MHIGYWWESQKRPLGRPIRREVDNIKMDLRDLGWDGVDWIDMAQDRGQWMVPVNMILNLLVPLNAGKFLSGCTIGGFSSRAQLR
jgi:transposase